MFTASHHGDVALGAASIGHFFINLWCYVYVADVLLYHLVAAGLTVLYLALTLDHKQPLLATER
jgi:hypothetical protein